MTNYKRAKSILQDDESCFVCKTTLNLAPHEIYFGSSDREKSCKYGCWVYLCDKHHTATSMGVHQNPQLDKKLKQTAQELFEKYYAPSSYMGVPLEEEQQKEIGRNIFMSIFKKNYLD